MHVNMFKSEKFTYNYVVYNLNIEEKFAKELEVGSREKVYIILKIWSILILFMIRHNFYEIIIL